MASQQQKRMEILEAEMRKLQERVFRDATSQVKLEHLKGKQERENVEWREKERYLEEKLATARKECQSWKREAQGSRNGMREGEMPNSSMHRVRFGLVCLSRLSGP